MQAGACATCLPPTLHPLQPVRLAACLPLPQVCADLCFFEVHGLHRRRSHAPCHISSVLSKVRDSIVRPLHVSNVLNKTTARWYVDPSRPTAHFRFTWMSGTLSWPAATNTGAAAAGKHAQSHAVVGCHLRRLPGIDRCSSWSPISGMNGRTPWRKFILHSFGTLTVRGGMVCRQQDKASKGKQKRTRQWWLGTDFAGLGAGRGTGCGIYMTARVLSYPASPGRGQPSPLVPQRDSTALGSQQVFIH